MGEEFEEEVEKEEWTVLGWLIGTAAGDDRGKTEGEGAGAVSCLAAQERVAKEVVMDGWRRDSLRSSASAYVFEFFQTQ